MKIFSPGSFGWLLGHEIRLTLREMMGKAKGGKRRWIGVIILFAMLGIGAGFPLGLVARRFDVDSFRVDGRLYRVMVHYNGDQGGQRERFVRDIEKIVRYENRVIAPPPLDMYTFMFHIGYAGRDGMEHLYSTQIITADPWTEDRYA